MVGASEMNWTVWVPENLHLDPSLSRAVRRVGTELRAEEIWLFGSRAESRARPGSDYDLLAVLPDDASEGDLDLVAAWELVRGAGIPIDLIPCTRSEFEDEKDEIDSLPQAAYRRGWCLYMSTEKRVRAFLDLMDEDIRAAEVLASAGNRYAAFHCQQAVEKLLKALLLNAGKEAGTEHRLDMLAERLGEEHPWRKELAPLEKYTPYATTFRYPTPGGRIPQAPPGDEVRSDLATLRDLHSRAKQELVPAK